MRALLAFALLAVASALQCDDGDVRVLVTLPLDSEPAKISAVLTDDATSATIATLHFTAAQANSVFTHEYCIAFGQCVTLTVTSTDGSIEYNEELNSGYYGVSVDTYYGWKDILTGNVMWESSPYVVSGCFDPCSDVDCHHGHCESESGSWSSWCVCDDGYAGWACDQVDCQASGQGSLELWINSGYNDSFVVTHSIVGSNVDISTTDQSGQGWVLYAYCVPDGACVDVSVVASDPEALEGYSLKYTDPRWTSFDIWNSYDSYNYYDESVSTHVCLSPCGDDGAAGLADCGVGSCVDTTNGSYSTSWECQCPEHYFGWQCENYGCDSVGGFQVTLSDFESLAQVSILITREGGAVVAADGEWTDDESYGGCAQRTYCMTADGASYQLTVQANGLDVSGSVTFGYGAPTDYAEWWSGDTLSTSEWGSLPISLQLVLDPCSQWPCLNGAYCNTTSIEEFEYTCECTEDWWGDLCQYPTCSSTNGTFIEVWFDNPSESNDNWELLRGDASLAAGTIYGSTDAYACVNVYDCYTFYFMSNEQDQNETRTSYTITLVTSYNWVRVIENEPALLGAPTVTDFCTTPCALAPEECANGGSCSDLINDWQFEFNCTCEGDWEGEFCTLPVCEDDKSRLVFAFNAFPTTTVTLALQDETGVFPPFFEMTGNAVGNDYPVYDQDTFYTFCVPDDFSLLVQFVDTSDGFTYVHYQLSFAGEYLREPTDDKLFFSGEHSETFGAVVGSTASNDDVGSTASDSSTAPGNDDDDDTYTGGAHATAASPIVAALVAVASVFSVFFCQ